MRRSWWRLVVLVGIVGGAGEALLAIADPFVVVFSAIFLVGAAMAIAGGSPAWSSSGFSR
jgi:uncharacterized membrane protein YhaH (DUF805 family)